MHEESSCFPKQKDGAQAKTRGHKGVQARVAGRPREKQDLGAGALATKGLAASGWRRAAMSGIVGCLRHSHFLSQQVRSNPVHLAAAERALAFI